MSYDRISPALERVPPPRPAPDGVARLVRSDATLPSARPPLPLDREALAESGLWGFAPLDPRARPFVRLRSQLLGRLPRGERGRVIAIASPRAGDGKSFVAANLAAALGQLHSVCLIDLDLRSPAIGGLFGAPECAGVDALLAGERNLGDIGCVAADARLVVLPAQRPVADATRLLASPALPALFETLRRDPDMICLVDTPPILDMDDAILIARQVDGVLLVVEEGRTAARDVREALRLIAPTPLVGSVLNRALKGGR